MEHTLIKTLMLYGSKERIKVYKGNSNNATYYWVSIPSQQPEDDVTIHDLQTVLEKWSDSDLHWRTTPIFNNMNHEVNMDFSLERFRLKTFYIADNLCPYGHPSQRSKCDDYEPLKLACNDGRLLSQSPLNAGINKETANIEYWDNGRQRYIVAKPGRFASKVLVDIYNDEPMTGSDIQKFAELCKNFSDRYELKFTNEPNEIKRVYTTGPHSCMAYKDELSHHVTNPKTGKSKRRHASEVYASPDFMVAYLVDKLNNSKIVARTLVSTVLKQWVRIYGDTSLICDMLEEEGYTEYHDKNDFRGHRLKMYHRDHDNYLMPYLDTACYAHTRLDDDEYLYIGKWPKRSSSAMKEGVYGEATCGYGRITKRRCGHCDNLDDSDNMSRSGIWQGKDGNNPDSTPEIMWLCSQCSTYKFNQARGLNNVTRFDGSNLYRKDDPDITFVKGWGWYSIFSKDIKFSHRRDAYVLTVEYSEAYENYKATCRSCNKLFDEDDVKLRLIMQRDPFRMSGWDSYETFICDSCADENYVLANHTYHHLRVDSYFDLRNDDVIRGIDGLGYSIQTVMSRSAPAIQRIGELLRTVDSDVSVNAAPLDYGLGAVLNSPVFEISPVAAAELASITRNTNSR